MSTWAIVILTAVVSCLLTRLLSKPAVSGWYDMDDMGWSDHGYMVTLTDGRREFFTGRTNVAFDSDTDSFVLSRMEEGSGERREITRFHEHRVVSFKILTT